MPTLTTEYLIDLLTQYVADTDAPVDLLVVGALALRADGVPVRATFDVDAEVLSQKTVELFCKHLPSSHE